MGQIIEKHDISEEWRMREELDNLIRRWHHNDLLPNHHLIIREKAEQYKRETGKEYLYSLATDFYEEGD